MLKKSFSILSTSIILSACGGGGGGGSNGSAPELPTNDPSVYTGTFVDSPVEGLYFETESLSGLTNENGEFYYRDGERVEFSIGGISLGTTSATETVTPFTLVGITPITTELGITTALTSENFNSFDRAINIATLLQALDEDGDPSNGIDLGDANAALKDSSINLFVKAPDFEKQDAFFDVRRKLDIGHRRTFGQAVQHMYESLEIDIESTQVAEFSSAQNNNSLQTISYEYDLDGKITVQNTDIDNDGTPDISKSFNYDDRGNISQISNSATQTVESMSYDANDNILTRLIDNPDTANDLQENYTYVSSKLIRLELDKQADGTPDTITTYDYDSNGNLTSYEVDRNGDGEPDGVAEYSYSGDLVVAFVEDKNNDGLPNFIAAYHYDQNGNRASHNIDITADGYPNTISLFTYDDNHNVIRYEQDNDLDGTADYIEDYRYDNQKNRTQYRRDNEADGVWDSVAQYQYDINGNRTRMIEDSDGNGIVDKIWQGNYQAAVLDNSWEAILGQL